MHVIKTHRCFDGTVRFCEHESATTQTKMKFSTFVPEGGVRGCLIWLSGLTCTEENFMSKAGAQKSLRDAGLMVICPDTSPRGLDLPDEHESWDFGSGAGFYVNATTEGYRDHYRMYDYVVNDVVGLIRQHFPQVEDRISISGHSMGGHGALVLGLREPNLFKSISAFSPIVNPTECPWGQKAFTGYLGGNQKEDWTQYDACELIRAGRRHPRALYIDQGEADSFLAQELLTSHLVEVCRATDQIANVRMHEGYDHSYYFIATFIDDHVRFHAAALGIRSND